MDQFDVQVKPQTYLNANYLHINRFVSYYAQVNLALESEPESILEIGVGNKVVYNLLKQIVPEVKSCDFDKELEPNIVGDIRKLPIEDNSFDLVMACEVLEHLPWEDVDKALGELKRVSRKKVLISLPYPSKNFEFIFRFPLIQSLFKVNHFNFLLRLPFKLKRIDIKDNGQHYWEVGRENYPLKEVRAKLSEYFTISKELTPPMDQFHIYFVLEV